MSPTPASIDQVVIDFMSPTCGPCHAIAPVFAECAKEYPTKAVFLKVDILELEVIINSPNHVHACIRFRFNPIIMSCRTLLIMLAVFPCSTYRKLLIATTSRGRRPSSSSGTL